MLLDYIVGLGMDAFKGYLTEKYDERQMKADIKSYVAKQQKLNINCVVEEELDFGGIVKYLCTDFHEDIEQRFTGETSQIRGQAHKHIVAMAASYAHAHTPDQKGRVKRMISDALNILRSYYEKSFHGSKNTWHLELQTMLYKALLLNMKSKRSGFFKQLKRTRFHLLYAMTKLDRWLRKENLIYLGMP